VAALAAVVLVIAFVALASGGSPAHRVASVRQHRTASTVTVVHRRSLARRAPATTPTTAARATTASTPTATTPTGSAHTVPGAVAALTALTTQGVQSGAIDPHAGQQIVTGLAGILNSWKTGKTIDAQHHLVDLSHQMSVLAAHGQIASAAAPPLGSALANLGSILASAAPAPTQTAGPPPPDGGVGSPGHDGFPPGRAKHFDTHGNGNGNGD
jgi:hypothetical protein